MKDEKIAFFLQFLPLMMNTLDLHGTMLSFAVLSLIGAIFLYVILPETKGKSLVEIMKILDH